MKLGSIFRKTLDFGPAGAYSLVSAFKTTASAAREAHGRVEMLLKDVAKIEDRYLVGVLWENEGPNAEQIRGDIMALAAEVRRLLNAWET